MGHEGGYANNPADRGGETYKGIARNYWPRWSGWKYIDGLTIQLVKQPEYGTKAYFNWAKFLNEKLEAIVALQQLVLGFYKMNFWKDLDEIDSQVIATWVYDKDVNTGSMGSRWLQEALGVVIDGRIGPKTIAAANSADPLALLDEMKEHATHYYLELAQKPNQAGFWKSWISRVGLSTERLAQANFEARNLGIIA
jgi:lysozyme family protein